MGNCSQALSERREGEGRGGDGREGTGEEREGREGRGRNTPHILITAVHSIPIGLMLMEVKPLPKGELS